MIPPTLQNGGVFTKKPPGPSMVVAAALTAKEISVFGNCKSLSDAQGVAAVIDTAHSEAVTKKRNGFIG